MKVKKVFKEICELNLMEIMLLIELIKEKFNLNKSLMEINNGNNLGIKGSDLNKKTNEENKEINKNQLKKVILIKINGNKLALIKYLRSYLKINLREAKELTDNLPKTLLTKQEEKQIKIFRKGLEGIDCEIEINND